MAACNLISTVSHKSCSAILRFVAFESLPNASSNTPDIPAATFDRLAWRKCRSTCTSLRQTSFLSTHHEDRKSTRLNSSHGYISYAVFCLKKKNQPQVSLNYPV